jgi:uracil-DNA glycosylase
MPMGFCYPGRYPQGGDLPPRRECVLLWHERLLEQWPRIDLTLLVGSYAINHYLAGRRQQTMTATVAAWRDYLPRFLPLPHPSWRTTAWEKNHPWFAMELVPEVRRRVTALTI